MRATLSARLRRRFARWLGRRIPPARSVTLNQRRIFIMPSRVGLFFFFTLAVMLIAAINYQNNMSYALTFLLTTLFVVAVLHTYANLSGLTLHAVRASPAYPGQVTEFHLRLDSGARERYALHLGWAGQPEQEMGLAAGTSQDLRLYAQVAKRGWFHPGRLRVESTFPLGLLRCWTWVDLDLAALVYPQPLTCKEMPASIGERPEGQTVAVAGTDDFFGFREYRPGDSLRHLHWRGYAKGQPLQSKQYAAYSDRSVWLDWDAFAGVPVETRLSYLCFLALEFERKSEDYGLRLPGRELAPDHGDRHREQVLSALALYGIEESP